LLHGREPSSPAAEPATGPDLTACPVFDAEAALARVEGDVELFGQMAQLFARQSPSLLSAIGDAIAQRDGPALERVAHKFKGSIGNFGSQAAFQAALDLEERGRHAKFDGSSEAFAQLRGHVEALQNALADFVDERIPCAS
jgi:HPt (histidine-containing phosphotransfer) domain-containing protein